MSRHLVISWVEINDDSDCDVIAENGHNHQGQLETAKELFRAAKACCTDEVKLQEWNNRALYVRTTNNQPHDHENSYDAAYGQHQKVLSVGCADITHMSWENVR